MHENDLLSVGIEDPRWYHQVLGMLLVPVAFFAIGLLLWLGHFLLGAW